MKKGIVLHCAQYAAPYAGNFIRSLTALENRLSSFGIEMAYVFPSEASSQLWWKSFVSAHIAYCVDCGLNAAHTQKLAAIIQKTNPFIIHTHFEGYDELVVRSVKCINSDACIVWHMHDVLTYHQNPLKRLYQHWCFYRHYHCYGKGVAAIGVSQEILSFTSSYRKLFGGSFRKSVVIPNGVDSSRLSQRDWNVNHSSFTFLAFGGRNVQKRIDLLLSSAQKLRESYDIRVLVTEGTDTRDVMNTFFSGNIPEWCQIIPQSDDVNSIFSLADCFVSTSVHETFSYAICEASFYGLPVIQSDIEGTKWNANNPSTFVFSSGSQKELYDVMQCVVNKRKSELWKICEKTRIANMENYGIDRWSERIIDFYEQQ